MTELEDTREFRPRFDEHGLIGAIVTDASDNSVLMFAFMNDEALRLSRHVLSLPMGPFLSDADIDRICTSVLAAEYDAVGAME